MLSLRKSPRSMISFPIVSKFSIHPSYFLWHECLSYHLPSPPFRRYLMPRSSFGDQEIISQPVNHTHTLIQLGVLVCTIRIFLTSSWSDRLVRSLFDIVNHWIEGPYGLPLIYSRLESISWATSIRTIMGAFRVVCCITGGQDQFVIG